MNKERIIAFIKDKQIGQYDEKRTFAGETSYHIGGKISLYVEVNSFRHLQLLIQYCYCQKVPYFIIGHGTNLLVSDESFEIIVISLKKIKVQKMIADNILLVSAGSSALLLGYRLSKEGYEGFEGLALIPGSVGGAIYMNASAYKKDLEPIVVGVIYLNESGKFLLLKPPFFTGYRQSIFQKRQGVICYVFFKVVKATDQSLPLQRVKKYWQQKKENQPLGSYNAGSVFKNPKECAAWSLISDCGLRGYQEGGAQISTKHANFFINQNKATFDDMFNLIEKAKKAVLLKYHIHLECEIKIIRKCDISPY